MNLTNVIVVGLKEIWAHKFRSLLTMLGIILGVSSLVAMSSLVKGMENGLKEALVAAGGLEKIRVEEEDDLPPYQQHLADQAVGVTLKDVYALQSSAPLVNKITPSVDLWGFRSSVVVSKNGKNARPYMISGTWPNALEIHEHTIAHGRMFNEIDEEEARNVCVIGTGIRDELFGDPDVTGQEIIPIGDTLTINQQTFTIIGMFDHYEGEQAKRERLLALEEARKKGKVGVEPPKSSRYGNAKGGHFIFRMKNNTIFIPLNTMLLKFKSASSTEQSFDPRLSTLYMKVARIDLLNQALQQVRNVLMVTHKGIEDFTFRTDEGWADEITTTIKNARMSGTIIAAISLIVGGIGIMNIMLASISERVREIGIRKAIGAQTLAVFIQLLVESVIIAVLGGIAGLGASFALVHGIASFTPSDNAPVITFGALLFAFTCSVSVGIIAGLFPAFKGARLNPIQALRYE